MYTASDIRNVEFSKSMGGYKTAEVDVFIDRCAETVETLTAENQELNKKLSILADKLVEYRRDEDSIRSALLSAQRLGDSVVRDSNQKADAIIADANQQAEEIVRAAKENIKTYEAELERVKKEVGDFKANMLSLYKDHLSLLKSIPDAPVAVKVVEPVKVVSPVRPVAPVQPIVEETTAPVEQEAEEVKTAPVKSKFANLKFGEDYDIGEDQED